MRNWNTIPLYSFSRDGTDQLESIRVDLYKIGSGEMTNHPLIRHIASKNKPIIFSTGIVNFMK